MRIPRKISGAELIALLKRFGYMQIRQVGSHVRLVTDEKGIHRLTVPLHDPIKVGTLNSILNEVAVHFGKSKTDIVNDLFQ